MWEKRLSVGIVARFRIPFGTAGGEGIYGKRFSRLLGI